MTDFQFSKLFVAFVTIIFVVFISRIDGRVDAHPKRNSIFYYYSLGLAFSLLPLYFIIRPLLYVFYFSIGGGKDLKTNEVIDLLSYALAFLGYTVIGYAFNLKRIRIKYEIEKTKKRYLKFMLLPFTMIGWYLMTYYGAILFVKLTVIAFELFPGGIAFMISFGFMSMLAFGFIYFVAAGLPTLLEKLMKNLYGINWFSAITHSFMGFWGFYSIFSEYLHRPPQILSQGNFPVMFLKYMWETAPIRAIIVIIPLLASFVFFIYTTNLYLLIQRVRQKTAE